MRCSTTCYNFCGTHIAWWWKIYSRPKSIPRLIPPSFINCNPLLSLRGRDVVAQSHGANTTLVIQFPHADLCLRFVSHLFVPDLPLALFAAARVSSSSHWWFVLSVTAQTHCPNAQTDDHNVVTCWFLLICHFVFLLSSFFLNSSRWSCLVPWLFIPLYPCSQCSRYLLSRSI